MHLEHAVLQAQLNVGLPGGVHPVVERPVEAIGIVLRIAVEAAVAIGDEFLGVHPQIAVRVVHQPDVRRFGDEDSAIEYFQRSREHEVIGKYGSLVHATVVVRVLEDDDASDWIVLVRATDDRP